MEGGMEKSDPSRRGFLQIVAGAIAGVGREAPKIAAGAVALEAMAHFIPDWASVAQAAEPKTETQRAGLGLLKHTFERHAAIGEMFNKIGNAKGSASETLNISSAAVVKEALSQFPALKDAKMESFKIVISKSEGRLWISLYINSSNEPLVKVPGKKD